MSEISNSTPTSDSEGAEGVRSRISRDGQIEASQARVRAQTDTRNLNFVFSSASAQRFENKVTLESFLTETQRQGWTYA